MHVLTYRAPACSALHWRALLREVAATPAPNLAGLRSRYWRLDRGEITGRYLIDENEAGADLAHVAENDPALQQIRQHGQLELAQPASNEQVASDDMFERPVVLLAAPRSGSTLLYELLSQSVRLWTIDGESEGVIEGVSSLHPASRGFDSHRLTEADLTSVTSGAVRAAFLAEARTSTGQRYLSLAARDRPSRIRLLEKTTENALRVSFLNALFPDSCFVFLHRDSRQNVNSIYEAWHHEGFVKIPSLPGWKRRRWHLVLPEGWRAFNREPLFDVAAYQWASANAAALQDLEALPRDRWMSVDYAELVESHANVLQRICAFAGIEIDSGLEQAFARPLPVASTAITPPSPVKWRSNPAFREGAVRRYRGVAARLRTLESQSAPPPPSRAAAAPVRFSCFLDEIQPSGAIADSGECIVSPLFALQLGPTIPQTLLRRTRFRERFLPDHPLLWIEDLRTRVIYPFWIERRQACIFRQLVPGAPPPSGLDTQLAQRLLEANILTTQRRLAESLGAGDQFVEAARREFSESGYCVLRKLLGVAHVAALARYYEQLIAYGEWAAGDEQVRNRYGYHNETVARYFHLQLLDVVSRVVGESIKSTYSYVSAYREGAILKPHVDREQCIFTLSVWVDKEPETDGEPWPLWFHLTDRRIALIQQMGDAVLFRGSDLPHWRNAPPASRASTTLLFHYVPRSFAWSRD